MILDRLILQDMFAFARVDLPVGEIGPGLIAVVGRNGRGKTGLLEVVPGLAYQRLPAREDDHPVAYATSKEGVLEAHFTLEGRGAFRARLTLDGQTRGTAGVLETYDAAGTRVDITDGKVSTLKAALAALLPSYDLFINSAFAAQGRGDEFQQTKPTARKDLFAEFLGLARRLAQAQTAAQAASLVEATRDRLRAVRAALGADIGDEVLGALDARLTALRAQAAQGRQEKGALATQIAALEARLATMADAVAAHGAASLRVTTLSADLATRQAERALLSPQQAEADVRLTEACDAIQRDRDAEVRRLEASAVDTGAAARLAATMSVIDGKLAKNREVLARRDAILAAGATMAAATTRLIAIRQGLADARARKGEEDRALRQAEAALAALSPIETAHTRATDDAALLAQVPCEGAAPYDVCPLLVNAQAAHAELGALVAQLAPKAALADQVAACTRAVAARAEAIAALEQDERAQQALQAAHTADAALVERVRAADERIAELTTLRETTERDAAAAAVDLGHQRQTEIAAVLARAEARVNELRADHARARTERATALVNLDARIASLEADLATARADLAAVQDSHAAATVAQADLAAAREAWDTLTRTVATVESEQATAAARREDLVGRRARLADVEQRLAEVEQALVEWRELARLIGKGGLVDLELDAAGPTITATTNALLAGCFDGRFSIELVTQTEKADGSGMKDEFTVRVMDNRRAGGGWRDLKGLSGGQKTVIQEALMSAIALYVNERSDTPIRTCWRDETGAALDPVNAQHYIDMLRRVREIGHLHQIFFVSHNPEAAARADAQIVVEDGTARIVYPPFAPAAADSEAA